MVKLSPRQMGGLSTTMNAIHKYRALKRSFMEDKPGPVYLSVARVPHGDIQIERPMFQRIMQELVDELTAHVRDKYGVEVAEDD